MQNKLAGKRIAILVADGFEQVEMTEPRKALENAGARTDLISPAKEKVQAARHHDKGDQFPVDIPLSSARPDDYDALLLPGGVANPDQLRTMPQAVQFVRNFFDQHKPVAAICHGPWMLVEANVLHGRTVTSWPSLKTDLRNAGATWTDRPVVEENGLVTSRKPDDLPAFNEAMIEMFSKAGAREGELVGVSRGRRPKTL
jgi:protease I